jgi:lipoate-protein ligase B
MALATPLDRTPVDYLEAQSAQRVLVERRGRRTLPDLLWLLEHPPTITWGASGGLDHLLLTDEDLHRRGISLCKSERGGDVTCHEPGQLVGYPIVDLSGPSDRDLPVYLRCLEDGLLRYLRSQGIEGMRVEGRTGVWIGGTPERKIAAIGVRAKRWITSHGFALNVENDLGGFRFIVPCGIPDADVTSLARELGGRAPAWDEVCLGVHAAMEAALQRSLRLVVSREGLAIASRDSR